VILVSVECENCANHVSMIFTSVSILFNAGQMFTPLNYRAYSYSSTRVSFGVRALAARIPVMEEIP